MSFIDILIILVVLTVISLIIYFNFIKKKFSSCSSCPEYKKCSIDKGEGLKKYYQEVCEKEATNSCCS